MTIDDAPPMTRRSRRAHAAADPVEGPTDIARAALTSEAAEPADADPSASDADSAASAPAAVVEAEPAAPTTATGRLALTWVDDDDVAPVPPLASLDAPDLLAHRPRRNPLRPAVVVPILSILAVIAVYAATTLLWPLHAVAPTLTSAPIESVAATAAAPAWPAQGSAALAVDGISGTPTSSEDTASIASITKVVTSLMVLDELPLAVGEQGPSYSFTGSDRSSYWSYRSRGESALDVPVGGSLSEYQMLQGILMGSANNYADKLAATLWPSDAVFEDAASSWMSRHGLTGITIVDPTGIEEENAASPAALIALADKALANPVVAEIVRTASVDLPGAGTVANTNALLADPGVIGVKTGSLWQHFNLLTAKTLTIGETPVRVYASVLGQPDDAARDAASRALLAQLETELQLRPSVAAGTVVGVVTTLWGSQVDVVTTQDASVVLWNGGSGQASSDLSLGEARAAGETVGTVQVDGPLDTAVVDAELAAEIEDPSAWWRLTHPLELFGIAD